MYMGFADANMSNKNNRRLQRTGNAQYQYDKKAFLNSKIQRSERPLHDQYNYADRTPSVSKRLFIALFYILLFAAVVYAVKNYSFLDAGRLVG